jgi:S-adenosylmethionine decarboxylase proenzyme
MNKYLGHQVTLDFYDCSPNILDSVDQIKNIMESIVSTLNLSVVNTTIHHFSPIGVSGVVVIEESHITIHTWPEYGYVAMDFFTCNQEIDIEKAKEVLKNKFNSSKVEMNHLKRGDRTSLEARNLTKN